MDPLPTRKRKRLVDELNTKDVFYYQEEPGSEWKDGQLMLHLQKETEDAQDGFLKDVKYRKLRGVNRKLLQIVKGRSHEHMVFMYDYFVSPRPDLKKLQYVCIVERGQPDFIHHVRAYSSSLVSYDKIETKFKDQMRGLIRFFCFVHGRGVTLGNINPTSIWKVGCGANKYRIKLNLLEGRTSYVSFEETMKNDWISLSDIFMSWSSELKKCMKLDDVEFDDFCLYIKVLATERNSVKIMKRKLLSHPLFWDAEKTEFTVSFFNLMKAKKNFAFVDSKLGRMPYSWQKRVDYSLFQFLDSKRGRLVFQEYRKTDFIRFTRHGIEHLKDLPRQFQNLYRTRDEMMGYALTIYPRLIIEMWTLASNEKWLQHDFKFLR